MSRKNFTGPLTVERVVEHLATLQNEDGFPALTFTGWTLSSREKRVIQALTDLAGACSPFNDWWPQNRTTVVRQEVRFAVEIF